MQNINNIRIKAFKICYNCLINYNFIEMLGKIIKSVSVVLVTLLLIMLLITVINTPDSVENKSSKNLLTYDDSSGFMRFAESLRFKIIGNDDGTMDESSKQQLLQLHDWMRVKYPLLSARANWKIIGDGSVLITVFGKNPNLEAAMFLGHLDVVPVEDSAQWKYPPFAGKIVGDTLWGRGALDDKNAVISLLEAAEKLIASGRQPQRNILLAFGHDEETGGKSGAAEIAAYLKQSDIKIGFISDEGFGIMEGIVPGLKQPAAIIGLAEKGYLTLKIRVSVAGGHSAWPKQQNTVSELAEALNRLDNFQFASRLDGPVSGLFENAAPYMNFGYKFLFSNLWITKPLLKMVLEGGEKTAATIRTTHVTTIVRAGEKENVVPPFAEAIVNFRILPGENIQDIIDQVSRVIGNKNLSITKIGDSYEASPISPNSGLGYNEITTTLKDVIPDAVPMPGLVITGTDCKNYTGVCNRIYRFVPYRFNNNNLSGIHGKNEHVSRQSFYEATSFYLNLFSRL